MSIVTSVILSDYPQRDGRRSIHERHTDHTGVSYDVHYVGPNALDVQAAMATGAQRLAAYLARSEVSSNIRRVIADGRFAVVRVIHSTTAQNIAALRSEYREASRETSVMIGDFLSSLTDTQLRSIFNMTQAQVDSLRTNRLTPAAALADSLRSSGGV